MAKLSFTLTLHWIPQEDLPTWTYHLKCLIAFVFVWSHLYLDSLISVIDSQPELINRRKILNYSLSVLWRWVDVCTSVWPRERQHDECPYGLAFMSACHDGATILSVRVISSWMYQHCFTTSQYCWSLPVPNVGCWYFSDMSDTLEKG